MTDFFRFEPLTLPPECEALRQDVRQFIAEEKAGGGWRSSKGDFTQGHSPEFSKRLAQRGWVGMTWPKKYGGQERSFLERYVVTEELLAAGAPVGAHWVADRQSGPLILRFGTEEQREAILPRITKGECFFCIGMSEPDSGSDLASIRTKAVPVEGGWELSGRKIWTSNAHKAHFMICLCRTGPVDPGDRHKGLSPAHRRSEVGRHLGAAHQEPRRPRAFQRGAVRERFHPQLPYDRRARRRLEAGDERIGL